MPVSDPAEQNEPTGFTDNIEGTRRRDPMKMTSRERRNRIILLTLLVLLLLLLSYVAYYFAMNRRLPSLRIAPVADNTIPPPQYLYSIAGKDATALSRPVGVAVAPDGRVFVVDFGHRRVSIFTNQGRYLFSFNTTADGKLINPVHLQIKGNEIWLSERYYKTIFVFDLNGKYLRKFVPANETLSWSPLAFSFDASGALRTTDVGNTKLHRLLYFSTEGSRTASIGRTAEAQSLTQDPGMFFFPNGLAVAKNGDVYVADGNNRRVQVFNSKGEFLRFVDTSGVPRGVVLDSQQRLYVVDALANAVSVYDTKGKQITQFGERGFGPGQFNYPNDIALDQGGHIYVTDRENNQVQVWGWPVAKLPTITPPKSPVQWLALLACLIPLLLLPFLLYARRKIRIVVTPDFIDGLANLEQIAAVSQNSRIRFIAPEEHRPAYEGRTIEGVDLTELITFEEHSESDARAMADKLTIELPLAIVLSMADRAKALGTDDRDTRKIALLAEIRTFDTEEFMDVYMKRETSSGNKPAG
jgi:DNA-binding beta-propeller fold protein YncE